MSKKTVKNNRHSSKYLKRYGNIGIDLVSYVLVGIGIGYLVDKWLNTMPLFMIVGFLWGVVSVFVLLYRETKVENNEEKKKVK